MSAILSADDLNDFISPGVACIKPIETLPLQKPDETLVSPSQVFGGQALILGRIEFIRSHDGGQSSY